MTRACPRWLGGARGRAASGSRSGGRPLRCCGRWCRRWLSAAPTRWRAGHAIDEGPGRNATRYFIREPCELGKKYLIGGRAKYRITVYKGAPMPHEPKTDEEDNYEQFAEWFLTQKKPFSITSKIKNDDQTWTQAWEAYLGDLEHDACLYRAREKDECETMTMAEKRATKNMRNRRLVAASRLADIKNDLEGFTSTNKARAWSEAYRGRSRTLWNNTNRPSSKAPRQYCRGINEGMREVEAYIEETNDSVNFPNAKEESKAMQIREGNQKKLITKLPSARVNAIARQRQLAQGGELQRMWTTAAQQSMGRRVNSPGDVHACIMRPLPPRQQGINREPDTQPAPKKQKTTQWLQQDHNGAGTSTEGPFDAIEERTYERLRKDAVQAGRPTTEQPLNPQQREAARTLLNYAYHYHSLKETHTGEQIVAKAKEKDLAQITKVMGAAGVGKSQMIQATKKALEDAGLGVAVVTAYTGVAAAPFAGPTLLSLLNMSPKQRNQPLRKDAPATIARMRTKFEQECGIPAERVAALIIDEISFVDVNTLGHVSHNFSLLLETQLKEGDNRTLCGGLPVMLCGDNHQIPAPKATPWFTTLVEEAHAMTLRHRSDSGSPRPQGMNVLRQARLVTLTRQMRAIEDPDFVRDQTAMRETSVLQPVRKDFLDSIKVISAEDVEDDKSLLFTLIGVRGHWEGDAINQAQLKHFAEVNSLPIVKWRLTLQKRGQVKALLQGVILEELYENDPNAWAYFVQGAPILISDNLRSTRKLGKWHTWSPILAEH